MQPEDMILVSVDDHLVEPPNLFEGRLARKYADEAVRKRSRKTSLGTDGSEVWTFNGHHDVEIRSFDHGQFERAVGATVGSVSAKLDV